MSDSTSGNQPVQPKKTQVPEPDILDLDRIETTSGLDSINEASVRFESLTEATLKYETPKAREAREKKEFAEQAHKHVVGIIKILLASVLLLGFFALGVYLFAFKPDATEAQKTYATVVLTSIVSGGVGYTFGKQEKNVSDKE